MHQNNFLQVSKCSGTTEHTQFSTIYHLIYKYFFFLNQHRLIHFAHTYKHMYVHTRTHTRAQKIIPAEYFPQIFFF